MSRTTRLFDLLQTLRRHRYPVSGAALARETGVSLRTIYRDIAALQAMGAGIDGEPGLGYVLRPGFLLPPLMLSEEEIEALALGAAWVAGRTDDRLSRAAADAMGKLSAVLPDPLRRRIDDSVLSVGRCAQRPDPVPLSVLRDAARAERKLRIRYCDAADRRTERVVWPMMIGFFDQVRMLVAWCELRGGFRHFRTDRIETALPLPDRLPRRRRGLVTEWRSMLTESDSAPAHNRGATEGDAPMKPELVLYTNPLSRGSTAHWMLEETGVPYRMEVLDFGQAMHSPSYLAINPMGKVPALVHGGVVVTETAAICTYLADAFPQAGLAPDPADRGAYYRWLFFMAGCFEPALSDRALGLEPEGEQMRQVGYGSFDAVINTLAGALAGRSFIVGNRFTAADLYVSALLGWGLQTGQVAPRAEFDTYVALHRARPASVRVRAAMEAAMAAQWETT